MMSNASKADLICAAHYFGDCSMANFWSAFSCADFGEDFSAISNDGFGHIILVVPWALFQPRISEKDLDPFYVDRLLTLLRAAEQAGLKVILRLGYLWEVSPLRYPTFNRLKDYPASRPNQEAWEAYFHSLYDQVKECPAFDFAFVSWEDWYWPILVRIANAALDVRKTYAVESGFIAYLRMKCEFRTLKGRYGLAAGDWAELAVPARNEALYEEYVAFFDTIVSDRLFLTASTRFPGLEFEYRIDDEKLRSTNGIRLYPWSRARSGASRPIVYFHPNIGAGEQQVLSSAQASQKLRDLTALFFDERRSKKVFIDQFNFVMRNPQYPNYSSIDKSELLNFLQGAEDIIRDRTSGYGVWGYRDWINDKIYNGRFARGLDGWTVAGHVVPMTTSADRCVLEMEAYGALSQRLCQDGLKNPKLLIEGEAKEETRVRVEGHHGAAIEAALSGRFSRILDLPGPVEQSIELSVTAGLLTLERIGLFSHVLTSGLYTRDRRPRPAVAVLREMNRRLRARASATPEIGDPGDDAVARRHEVEQPVRPVLAALG